MDLATRPDVPLRGIVYVCLAYLLFAIMQALNKSLVGRHHVIEIAFYRNIIALVPCLIYVYVSKQYALLKSTMPGTLAARVTLGSIGLIVTFAATQELPLANATVLFFTATLLLPILARIFLNETVSMHRWCSVLIGMCGVLIVAQPSTSSSGFGVFLALTAAAIHASIQIYLRLMRGENPFTITFYFFLGGTCLAGALLPWYAQAPTADSIVLLIGVGISGGMAQYFLTRAFQMAPASLLSPFSYTSLLWASILDMLFWNYIPHWTLALGAAIIIGSQISLYLHERRTQNHQL